MKSRKKAAILTVPVVLISLLVILAFILRGELMALLPSLRSPLPKQSHTPIDPVITGSFTQPPSIDGYTTPEQWEAEFQTMRSAGLTLWIYQWTGDSSRKTTIYPTKIPGYSMNSPLDQVEVGLAVAQRHGVQVFMGLAFNDEWWSKEGTDRNWLKQETDTMSRVADELYQNYYSHYSNTFAGWYINWEMDNAAGYNLLPGQKKNMIDALAAITAHLKGLNPGLPTSVAPFFNSKIGVGTEQWKYFWYDVTRQTSLDIVMLQDGVGVNHATVDQLGPWFQAVCKGVRAAGKQCWSDLENFSQTGENAFIPAPPERVEQQRKAVAPYVDRIVTFSFVSYMSPVNGVDPKYLQAYLDSIKK